jgi:hypothetical protein
MQGFITEDNNYGVFPYGKQWMVVYHNEQLEVFKTQAQCKKFIKSHADSLNTVPDKPATPQKTTKLKQSSRTTSKKSVKKK